MIKCVCKDHCDKIKVPDPVVKDLISKKIVKQIISKKSKADFTVREVYFFRLFVRYKLLLKRVTDNSTVHLLIDLYSECCSTNVEQSQIRPCSK